MRYHRPDGKITHCDGCKKPLGYPEYGSMCEHCGDVFCYTCIDPSIQMVATCPSCGRRMQQ